MKFIALLLSASCFLLTSAFAAPAPGESPADHLPPHIRRLTAFGERADWSHDGKTLLFLSKTFGDAMEYDLASGTIRNLTAGYAHYGYTRALYLANGDILLAGPTAYDPNKINEARRHCYLFVLPKGSKQKPIALDALCNEGPAVSRRRLHIAWTEWTDPKPNPQPGDNLSGSKMFEADLSYEGGAPKLTNRRMIVAAEELPFRCTMETQNFRPPEERELTFSAYMEGGRKSDVAIIDLATKKVTNLTHSPEVYDEPEGIYPDGSATLVECDDQNRQGPGHIDLWKLALDGSGTYTRLTHFSDYPNYKASNPVISDDGRYIAFQMGKAGEDAGIGHGIFLYDFAKAK